MESKFLDVWSESLGDKCCSNQIFLYHWKPLQTYIFKIILFFKFEAMNKKITTKNKLKVIFFNTPSPLSTWVLFSPREKTFFLKEKTFSLKNLTPNFELLFSNWEWKTILNICFIHERTNKFGKKNKILKLLVERGRF